MQRRRLIHLCFVVGGRILSLLPRRLAFLLLLFCYKAKLPGHRFLARAYEPFVVAFLARKPDGSFAGRLGHKLPALSAQVLFGIGAYREACEYFNEEALAVRSVEMASMMTRALFELGEFKRAREVASIRSSAVDFWRHPGLGFLKSILDMIHDDECSAVESLNRARRGSPDLMRPHQNIAARSVSRYKPNYLDVEAGDCGALFDLCNFAGQRVTHVGHGEIGMRLFGRALQAQSELQCRPPQLSDALTRLLQTMEISLDELQIIPEEWTTQIGHLGMLDILFRMRELGWWSGKALMVARPQLVANAPFTRLFESFAKLVTIEDGDPVGEQLLSLQRWYGLNFNAFRLPNGNVVPWQEAGALAIEKWEREDRGHPLRDRYDAEFGGVPDVNRAFRLLREKWGMKPDDWYVCLHTRDASHYFELVGTGQTHRNAPIESYLDAIRFITNKGGWVIKLGSSSSPRLPAMEHTIDYAFSRFKSDLLDIHLIRNAKAFIGTTSGLTNVAISFGIPSALVNCITTDSQLWNSNVRFALKPVRLVNGRLLTQRELTSDPWRWRLFDAAVLTRSMAGPENNTTDEICEVVKEVEALASGKSSTFEKDYDSPALLKLWRSQLASSCYYGTARPSLYYLKKYEREFLAKFEQSAL